jgi:hypothetical protein
LKGRKEEIERKEVKEGKTKDLGGGRAHTAKDANVAPQLLHHVEQSLAFLKGDDDVGGGDDNDNDDR